MHVSIVIPTLNEEKRIGQCLETLRRQKFDGNYEIIIGDGGSTDKTLDIAEALADKIVIEKKPTIAAGRQAAALNAKGRVIAFTDADAILPPNWLEKLTAPFEHTHIVSAHGPVHLLEATAIEELLAKHMFPLYLRAANRIGVPSGAGCNLAVSKNAFEKVGGFDTDLVTAEDVELQKKLMRIGKTVFVPDAVAFVSARRIRDWGYLKFMRFHAGNWLRSATNRPPKRKYEPIR